MFRRSSRRESAGSRNPDHVLHNVFHHPGSGASLRLARDYYQPLLCQFHLARFPFDTQTCSFTFRPATDRHLVDLHVDNFTYTGPQDMSEYFVKHIDMARRTPDNQVILNISLGRNILNDVLVNFFPTTVIIVVVFLTSFFKESRFETTIALSVIGRTALGRMALVSAMREAIWRENVHMQTF